jgi:hypothetical protein
MKLIKLPSLELALAPALALLSITHFVTVVQPTQEAYDGTR